MLWTFNFKAFFYCVVGLLYVWSYPSPRISPGKRRSTVRVKHFGCLLKMLIVRLSYITSISYWNRSFVKMSMSSNSLFQCLNLYHLNISSGKLLEHIHMLHYTVKRLFDPPPPKMYNMDKLRSTFGFLPYSKIQATNEENYVLTMK